MPLGCNLPPLPEAAGGNTCADPTSARERCAETQKARLDAVMETTDHRMEGQRQCIRNIRTARAQYYARNEDGFRETHEIILAYGANEFPAYIKQLHYQRCLSAYLWWSANDIGCSQGAKHIDI